MTYMKTSEETDIVDEMAEPVRAERVGVIVVHGIGEQKRGDHLEEVVRPIVEGLARDDGKRALSQRRVVVHEPYMGDGPARVQVDVGWQNGDGKYGITEITFHEVHWADINEPNSIGKGLRFWLWGLSAWLTPGKFDIGKDTVFGETMATPVFPGRDPTENLMLLDRLQLFLVGWIFLLAAPPIVVADFIAKKIFNTTLPATLQTIVSYVSAVKLYTQERRAGQGMLASCNEPPRFAIRGRMAAVLVEVATAKKAYDRWYVLAHSQGTVVAFNGLMAPGRMWPNYLDHAALSELRKFGIAGKWRDERRDGPPLAKVLNDVALAPPIPPLRLEDDIVVYRDQLFRRFRGLLTYGSPLDKFAAIWPPTVAINRQTHVFPSESEWVNVWDPTDPVGGSLDAFEPKRVLGAAYQETSDDGVKPLVPINIPCRASDVFLASHIAYLRGLAGGTQLLACWAGNWMLGIATPEHLTEQLDRDGRLIGPRAKEVSEQASISLRAVNRRSLLSLSLMLLVLVPFLLWGWVQIGGGLRSHAPDYVPGPLLSFLSYAATPVLWIYDTVAGALPHWCVDVVVPLCLNELAGAAIISLLMLAVAGPIGRWLTPLDPRDQRSDGGARTSVLKDDLHRMKTTIAKALKRGR